jgi:hypothetical protein
MRMSVRFPAFAALLALLSLLAACSLPPYNEDLSLALITKSKMQLVNVIGPVHAWLDDNAPETEYYFLPDRNDPVNGGGFFVNTASYGMQVRYFRDDSSTFEGWWAINLDNDDETANNYLLQPIQSAAQHYLSLIRYATNDLFLIQATSPSNVDALPAFPVSLSTELAGYGAAPVIAVGSNIYPDSDADFDDLQYVLVKGSGGLYSEVECETDEANGANIIVEIGPIGFALDSLPTTLQNAFYGHDPNTDTSYLSYWSGSERAYKSYSWTSFTAPAGFKALPGIKGPINAVLTNGQLLSFKDGACTVYNGDGSKLYRFPQGGLRFCYERYDTAAAKFKLYFSLAYWLYGSDEVDDRLFVEVYAIPTADLKDLD